MYELSLIKNPNGSHQYVGSVPYDLAYEHKDGSPATKEEVIKDLRLPSNLRQLKRKTY